MTELIALSQPIEQPVPSPTEPTASINRKRSSESNGKFRRLLHGVSLSSITGTRRAPTKSDSEFTLSSKLAPEEQNRPGGMNKSYGDLNEVSGVSNNNASTPVNNNNNPVLGNESAIYSASSMLSNVAMTIAVAPQCSLSDIPNTSDLAGQTINLQKTLLSKAGKPGNIRFHNELLFN